MRRARGGERMGRVFQRITVWQTRYPYRVLGFAALSVVVALLLASQLSLETSFGELLPQNKESVIVAERVAKRLPSLSTLTVVIEGEDNDALKRFVDALVVELGKIEPEYINRVETGAKEAREFFGENRFLYADLDLVQEVHDEIQERYDYEVNKEAGFLLDEEDPPPPITEASIRARLEGKDGKTKDGKTKDGKTAKKKRERFPEYFLDEDTHTIAVLIRTPISSGDLERSGELRQSVLAAVKRVEQSQGEVGQVGLTGNLITSAETHEQIKNDLAHVGLWGGTLILAIVFLFYLRLRTLLAMALTVSIGASWTFGFAYVAIGHLNSSTGFLFSIVVGNGINFGIIFMARYLESRRYKGVGESMLTAHLDTWLSTLTAAGAASAAYGSLVVTDFRGFKHFGVIGGTGMLLCWIATYAFLPSILTLSERFSPIKPPTGLIAKIRGFYGRPFAWLANGFPRAVLLAGFVVTAAAGYLAYGFVVDPMEYDMGNIANDSPKVKATGARALSHKVDAIVGRQGQDGLAIVVDRIEQVAPLKRALEEVRARAPEGRKPFDDVVTIHSLVPTEQAPKIALIEATLDRLERAHRHRWVSEKDWKEIQELLPKKDLQPITIHDLPPPVARSFMELDGTLGTLVYIVPAKGRSVWDGRYLIEFADGFRETTLPDGSVVKGSGNQVIYADMILNVVEDAPKAIIVSLLGTLLVIMVAFRWRGSGLWVVGSVLVGFVWMLAVLAVWHTDWGKLISGDVGFTALKLNFLNFVALPITIGVGADYAVNVMQRYRIVSGFSEVAKGSTAVRRVVVETGGAVILCSLTTIFGYSALTLSVNRAIRSFGVAAAAGEICCVITGVLVLPAMLTYLARRREARAAVDAKR